MLHASCASHVADVYLVRCRRSLCGHCIGHYHCPLCIATRAKHTNIKRHLIKQHGALPLAFGDSNSVEEIIGTGGEAVLRDIGGKQMALGDHRYQMLDTTEGVESEDEADVASKMVSCVEALTLIVQRHWFFRCADMLTVSC